MRTLPLAALLSLTATFAFAQDATGPVREVMKITEENWDTVDSEWKFIFDADPLARLFSKQFQDIYREAAKKPAYDTENGEPGDPFGYDVITASQDGCPLSDVQIGSPAQKDAVTDVKVTFKLWTCIEEPEIKNSVNEVHFDIVTEDGRPVISDIHRVAEGESDSLVEEMRLIAKGE